MRCHDSLRLLEIHRGPRRRDRMVSQPFLFNWLRRVRATKCPGRAIGKLDGKWLSQRRCLSATAALWPRSVTMVSLPPTMVSLYRSRPQDCEGFCYLAMLYLGCTSLHRCPSLVRQVPHGMIYFYSSSTSLPLRPILGTFLPWLAMRAARPDQLALEACKGTDHQNGSVLCSNMCDHL
jgi:hypothetical protein